MIFKQLDPAGDEDALVADLKDNDADKAGKTSLQKIFKTSFAGVFGFLF
ncbi:MAG: hypothetical protein IPH36_07080 [Saprospiraceae bacterium]|nr:hypothetical protein [Saprospiraceae bacterium]